MRFSGGGAVRAPLSDCVTSARSSVLTASNFGAIKSALHRLPQLRITSLFSGESRVGLFALRVGGVTCSGVLAGVAAHLP